MTYGAGELRTNISLAWKLCEQIGIQEMFNPGASYDAVGAAEAKRLTYVEEYQRYRSTGRWTILLNDGSLLQFKFDERNPRSHLSYVFLESPFEVLTFAEFARLRHRDLDVDRDRQSIEELLRDEYAAYQEAPDAEKSHVTPLRYDYSPELYTSGRHPASHLHIGHQSEIRIATGRLLKPTSFVCLIARQCYPRAWEAFLRSNEDAPRHCRQVHEELTPVSATYFQTFDLLETGFDLPRNPSGLAATPGGATPGKRR
jgi:hypothetical protein